MNYLNDCKAKNVYPYKFFNSEPVKEVRIGQKYYLSSREIMATEYLGPKRTAASRASGKINMIKGANGGSEKEKFLEINGLQGELLFAKIFNVYPEEQLEIKPRDSKDDKGDVVYKNLRIDVKTTEFYTGRLTLSDWKHAQNIDALCLFTGMNGEFIFRGFYWAKELVKNENFRCLPGKTKPQYIMEQKNLLSFDQLIAY